MSLLRWIAGLSALLFLPPTLEVCAAADALVDPALFLKAEQPKKAARHK